MSIQWRLKEYLTEHRIKPGELAKLTEGKLSRTAIYGLIQDAPPQGVNFATLNAILPALERITGEPVEVGDLIAYEPVRLPTQKASWRKLIGALDDPDSPGDVAERHDHYLGEALAEEHDAMTLRGTR